MTKIPVNIFMGQLGAGKTTVILNLIKQLNSDNEVNPSDIIWLKNEYGDVSVDSELAKESNIQVKEVLNGCLCCVLIGKLHNAIEEIIQKYSPKRIIIETAGTAYPYPIVHELAEIKELTLDSLNLIIDVLNFERFGDRSVMAKNQGKFIDLIVLNKYELLEKENQTEKFDIVEDQIYELYPDVPKTKSSKGIVSKDLLIGINSSNYKELETMKDDSELLHYHDEEIEAFSFTSSNTNTFDLEKLKNYLESLKNDDFYRIKGIVRTNNGSRLINWVYGRLDISELKGYMGDNKMNFVGRKIGGLKDKVISELNSISN